MVRMVTIGSTSRNFHGRRSDDLNSSVITSGFFASAWKRYALPVAFDNVAARNRRRRGAYVSAVRKARAKRTTPQKIARNPSTHRHPAFRPRKPPEMGPSAGPRNGAAAKRAMPRPRWLASSTSEMTPPALASGEEPKRPDRKRKTRTWVMFCDAAVTAVQSVRNA